MAFKVWDFWASRYDKLWVQKYSLKPTRNYILKLIEKGHRDNKSLKVLDLGCGPGELIEEIRKKYESYDITGIDYSEAMLGISMERNPQVNHICMDAAELDKYDDDFDLIICTHSFPYYKDKAKVIADLSNVLKDDGQIFIAFASGNSFYDKLCLFIVKFTTGTAFYPSDFQFRELVKPRLEIETLGIIKEKFFMPRIAVYVLKKVRK